MLLTTGKELEFQKILDEELVQVHFQPIFSIHERKIVAFEGLSRGIHPVTHGLIPPMALLKTARENNRTLELDRLFRKKILESFRGAFPQPHDLILCLNLETSILDQENGTPHLAELCRRLGLNPGNIVIEILESKVRNVQALDNFIRAHHALGFLVALDDVGKGHSNLDRIPVIQPDIIKIDRSLVSNIQDDYYRQEIFKALVQLAHKIGAYALAEGVETEDEVLCSMELGANLLQGYYFSKPELPRAGFMEGMAGKMDSVVGHYKKYMLDKLNIRKHQHERYGQIIQYLVDDFSRMDRPEMQEKACQTILGNPVTKAVYVLDQSGIQLTDMSCKRDIQARKGFFKLPPPGTDHSSRDYFYVLTQPGFTRKTFTTDPYISPATGLFCLTISTLFTDKLGNINILCVDVVPTYFQRMGRLMAFSGD